MVEESRAELAPPSRETATDEDADSSRWPPVPYWARVTVVVLLVVVGFGLLWILRGVALVLVASWSLRSAFNRRSGGSKTGGYGEAGH